MAWREYVDPTTNEWWSTDDAGNFLPGRLSDNGLTGGSGGAATGGGGGGQVLGGGSAFLDPAINAATAAAQQQYLRDRLNQYDIPTMQSQRALADWQRQQQAMGQTGWYVPGTPGAGMTREQALDAIWQKRPDLKEFFASNGWGNLDDPAQQRKAVENWLSFSPEGTAAGGDPIRTAQALGIESAGGGISAGYAGQAGALPTFDREKYLEDVRRYGLDYAESQRRFNVGQGNWEQEFGEGQRRFNTQTGQWERTFGEGQRQFDVGTRLDYNRLLSTMQGPRNYRRYEEMLPEVFGAVTPGDSWEQAGTEFARSGRTEPSRAQLAGWYGQGAPSEAGGPGANPEYRNPNSYAAMGSGQLGRSERPIEFSEADRAKQNADYERRLAAAKPGEFVLESARIPNGQAGLQGFRLDGTALGGQGFTESPATFARGASNSGWETNAQKQARQRQPQFRQPTSIKADELATMSPTRKAMTESDWSYEGLDPADMWAQTQRAQPTGQAAANTRWRF